MNLSGEVIIENVRAYLGYESDPDRQMPDPLANLDIRWLVKHPPKAQDLMAAIERQHILNPAGVQWGSRKHDRSLRPMVLHNPYAELAMRMALASVAEQLVERQTDLAIAGRVELKSRTKNSPSVLVTRGHAKSHGMFRQQREAIVRRDPPVGIKTDIRSFYPSVTPQQVERDMRTFAPASVAFEVRLILEKHAIDTGVPGLPIGPESSACLANVVLTHADHVLQRFANVEALRWSDDLYLVDGIQPAVEECFGAWRQALSESGLTVSHQKTEKSWDLGISGGELVAKGRQSQGDISAAVAAEDWQRVANELRYELLTQEPERDYARVNRLFGALVTTDEVAPDVAYGIVDLMLRDPETWEQNVPRARAFLTKFGSPAHRDAMISLAKDLSADGLVASEQVIGLFRAASEAPSSRDEIAAHRRGHAAQRSLDLARAEDWVPLRGWARRAAYSLDPHMVTRQTIDTGEFWDLRPFEQRWAIAFADPRRHHGWLEKQRNSGRWPITAEWRLKAG